LVAEEGHSPAKVLNRVNHLLLKDFPTARFVTMIYGILDPKDASIVFASAGHCYPLLSDSSGTRFLKTDTGMPLGIQESDFSEQTIGIGAHSRLVLYSDGITEAMNLSSEQYGEARLVNHIADRSSSIDSLLNDVQIFNGSSPASDDTTVVMIESSRDNADIF